jgi:hypothetical protein
MLWSHQFFGGDRSLSAPENIPRAIKFGRNSILKLWVIYPHFFWKKADFVYSSGVMKYRGFLDFRRRGNDRFFVLHNYDIFYNYFNQTQIG